MGQSQQRVQTHMHLHLHNTACTGKVYRCSHCWEDAHHIGVMHVGGQQGFEQIPCQALIVPPAGEHFDGHLHTMPLACMRELYDVDAQMNSNMLCHVCGHPDCDPA